MGSEGRRTPLGRWLAVALLAVGCGELIGVRDSMVHGACETNRECAPGYGCLLGACRDGCSSDDECGEGSRCLRALDSTACIPILEGCGDGCPTGTRCSADEQCRTECQSEEHCAGGQLCQQGSCVGTDPAHDSPLVGGSEGGTGGAAPLGSPAGAGGLAGAGGELGQGGLTQGPCDDSGAVVCVGAAQKERRSCLNGEWGAAAPCAEGQNCDQSSGECASILDECLQHADGNAFCLDDAVATCGPDLVTMATQECEGKCVDLAPGADCAPIDCGDGEQQAPEECDDDNQDNEDACTNTCKDATCGDGFIWRDHEVCDDKNTSTSDACAECQDARCGDGFVRDGVEACDDENQSDLDECNNSCKLNNGGDCPDNEACANTCVAGKCVALPVLNASCDDDADCANNEAPGCSGGTCACDKTTCGASCVDLNINSSHCGDCDHGCLGGGCANGKCRPLVLVSGQTKPFRIVVSAQGIFWTNNTTDGAVMKAGLDGSNPTPLVSGGLTVSLAVDASHVYYLVEGGPPNFGVLNKVAIAGGTPTTLKTSIFAPQELVVDANNVYFSAAESGVGQIPKNGGSVTWLTPAFSCFGVALSGSSVLWSRGSSHFKHIGGGNPPLDLATNSNGYSVAVYNGELYFATSTDVKKISVFGGSVTPIASDQVNARGIAVDVTGVYWANKSAAGSIMRSTAAGLETLATGQGDPTSIALDADAVYWTNNSSGQIMKVAK